MSYVIDGDLSAAIQLPDVLTGAVFGPNVSRTYVGTRAALLSKIAELELDNRGVVYRLESQGESPLWHLVLDLTQAESTEDPGDPGYDPELPVNIVWRLTNEFAQIDYRELGRNQEVLNDDLDSDERREFNAFLEDLLAGTATSAPTWFPGKPAEVQAILAAMSSRFERGKSRTHVHFPVLRRDASFRAGASYRAKITEINSLLTSAALIALYPEIPAQFQARMPDNGYWKITANDWQVETSGQGTESIEWTWDEWYDPEDNLVMET